MVNAEALYREFESEFSSFTLPDRRDIVQYCLEEIELTNPPYAFAGPLDLTLSRYLIEPLQALQSDRVRQVVVCGSPRTGKTLILDAYLLYAFQNDPADILLCFHVKDIMRDFYNTRIIPLLSHNRVIDLEDDRHESTQKFIRLPNSTLRLVAVQNPNNLTALGARIVLATEAWRYPQGILGHIKGRTNDFPFSKKIYIESQASNEGTDFHTAWLQGHQARWGFKCPKCEKEQIYQLRYERKDGTYGGLNWDTNDYTKPNGVRDLQRTLETVRYDCIECKHGFGENDKRLLNQCGLYIPDNPKADPEIRSFTWNAMAAPNILFKQIAEKHIIAKRERKRSNKQLYIDFTQQEMATFWHEGLGLERFKLKVGVADDAEANATDTIRTCACDVQQGGNLLYYLILEWHKSLRTVKVIAYGKTDGFDSLHKINHTHGVKDQNVVVDSSEGVSTHMIYRECAKHGHFDAKTRYYCWSAVKGEAPKDGHYHNPVTKKNTFFSRPKMQDPNVKLNGVKLYTPFITFSANTTKSIAKSLLDGSHPDFKLFLSPEAMADEDFKAQLNSEHIVFKSGKPTWEPIKDHIDNHYWDTLSMSMVFGGILGFL